MIYIVYPDFSWFFRSNHFTRRRGSGESAQKEDIFIYQLSSDKSNNHFKAISFVDVNEGDFVDMLLHPRKS